MLGKGVHQEVMLSIIKNSSLKSSSLKSSSMGGLLGLLLFMLPVSMTGMEIFGWLTAFVGLGVMLKARVRATSDLQLRVGPDYFLWGLLTIVVISGVLSEASFKGLIEIIGDFRWILLLYGYSYFLRWFAMNRKKNLLTSLLFKVFIPVTIVVSLYGLFQSITGIDLIRPEKDWPSCTNFPGKDFIYSLSTKNCRISGFFSNPMTYAHMFVMWFCVLFTQLFVGKSSLSRKVLLGVALGTMGCSLIFSLTRGVWISGTAGLLVMLWLLGFKQFLRGVTALSILAVVGMVFFAPVRERVISIFGTKSGSNRQRIVLWQVQKEIFKDYPFFGIGYGKNRQRFDEYLVRLGKDPKKTFHGNAHNIYLEFLAGTGVLGLFCFLGILVYFILLAYKLWRKIPPEYPQDRALALGTIGAMVSLAVGGLTENNFTDQEVNHNIIFILAIVVALAYKHLKCCPGLSSVFINGSSQRDSSPPR